MTQWSIVSSSLPRWDSEWLILVLCGVRCRHRRPTSHKIWEGFSYGVYRPGEWLWIDCIGKIESRLPVDGSFGYKFKSIYHWGVMASGSRKVAKNFIFGDFLAKNVPLWEKFQNFVPICFIMTMIDVLCSNFVKFVKRELGKIVRCLPDKKNKICSARQIALLIRSSPKYARARWRECTQSAPDFTKIGSRLAELYPNAWTPSKWAGP